MATKWLQYFIPALFSTLYLSSQRLFQDRQAEERFDVLVKQEGVTEQLKAELLWVKKMNGIRERAEEMVREEMIYRL